MARFTRVDWQYWLSRWVLLSIGAAIIATSINIFYVPANIAPAGVSGLSVILNELTGLPIGWLIMGLNIPVLLLGFKMLSGFRTVAETVYVVALYSTLVEVLAPFLPDAGISDDMILNALFGGMIGGVGVGLVFHAGGTLGGTSTLAWILQDRFGLPLNTSSLYTDTSIFIGAGLTFGWEAALYSALALFISRTASDYILEGPSTALTALIVTDDPHGVINVLQETLRRGITYWHGYGGYTDEERGMVITSILRSEVPRLRQIIRMADPGAFVTILQAHSTYGRGFKSLYSPLPLKLGERETNLQISTQEVQKIKATDWPHDSKS